MAKKKKKKSAKPQPVSHVIIGDEDSIEFNDLSVFGPYSEADADEVCELLNGQANHGMYRVAPLIAPMTVSELKKLSGDE